MLLGGNIFQTYGDQGVFTRNKIRKLDRYYFVLAKRISLQMVLSPIESDKRTKIKTRMHSSRMRTDHAVFLYWMGGGIAGPL